MKNINSLLYKFSDMDKSSQILLFLIILVLLMLISITVINHITKKKNNKYDIDNKNIKRYSDLIKEEDKMEIFEVKNNKKAPKEMIVKNEKKNAPEIIEKLDEEEIESLEIEEPKEEVIVTKPSSIEEISKLIENTLEQEPIDLTNFEEEQEKDAIISYDELVKRAGAKKEPVKVIKSENKKIEDNSYKCKKSEYSGTFKASQIVSPVYGVQKDKSNDENFIDLEEFKINEKEDEMERETEFLGKLKTFRNNLD